MVCRLRVDSRVLGGRRLVGRGRGLDDPSGGIAGLDVYAEELGQYWVVGIGVSQYVLGVVVLAADLPRWPLWVAAIGWTALAAVTTPVVCVREEIDFRRYVQARAAYKESPRTASNLTSD